MEVVRFLLANAFVVVNNRLFRQHAGIEMGKESSPAIANLFAYSCESEFVDFCVRSMPKELILRGCNGWRNTSRYIDDRTAVVDVNVPDVGRLWPSSREYDGCELALVQDGNTLGGSVVALGLRIVATPGRFIVGTRDKQLTFPFEIIRYPTPSSTIIRSIRVGCVIGGLVRAFRFSTTPPLLKMSIYDFVEILRRRNFEQDVVAQGTRKFIAKHVKQPYRSAVATHLLGAFLNFNRADAHRPVLPPIVGARDASRVPILPDPPLPAVRALTQSSISIGDNFAALSLGADDLADELTTPRSHVSEDAESTLRISVDRAFRESQRSMLRTNARERDQSPTKVPRGLLPPLNWERRTSRRDGNFS